MILITIYQCALSSLHVWSGEWWTRQVQMNHVLNYMTWTVNVTQNGSWMGARRGKCDEEEDEEIPGDRKGTTRKLETGHRTWQMGQCFNACHWLILDIWKKKNNKLVGWVSWSRGWLCGVRIGTFVSITTVGWQWWVGRCGFWVGWKRLWVGHWLGHCDGFGDGNWFVHWDLLNNSVGRKSISLVTRFRRQCVCQLTALEGAVEVELATRISSFPSRGWRPNRASWWPGVSFLGFWPHFGEQRGRRPRRWRRWQRRPSVISFSWRKESK